jgi:hypothetical protein
MGLMGWMLSNFISCWGVEVENFCCCVDCGVGVGLEGGVLSGVLGLKLINFVWHATAVLIIHLVVTLS